MAYNKDIDPPLPHDISNLFAAADLLSRSSSDLAKYKLSCLTKKAIRYSILFAGDCPYL